MFFKFLKKQTLIFLLTLFIIPQTIFAYSDKILIGGETVGIKLNMDGVLIVGSYEINGRNLMVESGLKSGDIIYSINNYNIHNIQDMVSVIDSCNCNAIKLKYLRNNKEQNTNLELENDNGKLKTGLYVKDSISGVGTLTFVDPETKLFGVLGHEIADSNTGEIFNIKSGTIFDSEITGITRSNNGNPGEKNAILHSEKVNGEVLENTKKGIFGRYTSEIINNKLYNVATLNDIKIGNAKIFTVLEGNKVEEFSIKILSKSNTNDKLKNIQFEITDEDLLKRTNGIIQGMSGSPIIQDEYIIGAVTHVVVDNPHNGYGILITNMLEEAEN